MTPTDAPSLSPAPPRAFTWRSLSLGLLSTLFVCAAGPFNDIVLNDTSISAGYFPLALVLVLFVLIVCINAPLHRFLPRHALSSGELAVVTLMTLVACSLPAWGLMRFLAPTPVVPFYLGREDTIFWTQFLSMNLPPSLFAVEELDPTKFPPATDMAKEQYLRGMLSPIVDHFYRGRLHGEAIPWAAWLKPAFTWGIFISAMLATLVALARIIYPQWAQNERLPFPLVQVQAELIESPRPGRALNDVLRSPWMWTALGLVLFIHGLTCLNAYFPKNAPAVSLGYNFTGLFAEPPFSYLRNGVKTATLSFIVVGVTYFIRSRAALSLWGIYLLINLLEVGQNHVRGLPMSEGMWADQHMGACIAFILGMLWIGRAHWLLVLRNAFGAGEDARYSRSFWIAVLGTATMFGWLLWVGVTPWMAGLIVAIIIGAHIITSRIVAETGLPYFRSGLGAAQIYTNFPASAITPKDVYFAGTFNLLGPLATRDGTLGLTMHGIGVVESQMSADKVRKRLVGTILLTLVVGVLVAGAVTLWCHYTYPTPLDRNVVPAGNNFGAVYTPMRDVRNPVDQHATGAYSKGQHNPWVHMGIGFGIVTALEILALTVSWWPLLPIGFVASYGAFIQNAWFSIFVGWLVKVIIVRLGGASLFQQARPFFIGLIFGEGLAAAGWLIVNALVVMNGGQSQRVTFML